MKKKKILVVSHDAGGANILFSLIKKYRNEFNWQIYLAGPAKNIFFKKEIKFVAVSSELSTVAIDKILKSLRPDLLLTGTSGRSNLERNFIKSAKKNNIRSAAFLDHWINYRERFGYPSFWKENLPDWIFVGDKWAYKIAVKDGFPKKILRRVSNPYFEEIIEQTKPKRQKKSKQNLNDKIRLLYISEPTYQHVWKKHNNHRWEYLEYKILQDLLKIMELEQKRGALKLKIRLHPAEKTNKYSGLLKNRDYLKIRKFISISDPKKSLLVKDCLWADLVIGCNSMALFVAFLMGKEVVSYLPTKEQIFSFPQKEIRRTHSLDFLIPKFKHGKNDKIQFRKKNYLSPLKSFKQVFYKIITLN